MMPFYMADFMGNNGFNLFRVEHINQFRGDQQVAAEKIGADDRGGDGSSFN